MTHLTAEEVRQLLRDRIDREQIRMTTWARKNGFTAPYVSMVLTGVKEPSARLCQTLGVVKTHTYLPMKLVGVND
jgi:hypothetical protein